MRPAERLRLGQAKGFVREGEWPTVREADFEDSYLSSGPDRNRFQAVGGGILLPLVILAYGVSCLVSGEACLPGKTGVDLKVTGTPAWTFSLAAIMVALSVHFHYFWLSQPRLARFYQPCKVVTFAFALCLYVYTLGYVVFYL